MCQVQWQTSAMRKKLSMSLSCLRGDVADAYGIGGPCAVAAVRARARARAPHYETPSYNYAVP